MRSYNSVSVNNTLLNIDFINRLRRALIIDGVNTFNNQGSYQLICRINHSCDPNCMVINDGSVKSLRYIHKNEELTWNFLNDKYLYFSTEIRIAKLYDIWGFKCNCFRCNAHFDDVRVFNCIKCGKPSIYISYEINQNKDKNYLNILPKFHDCFECYYKLKLHEIEYYLSMETKIDDIIESILFKKCDYDQFKQSLNHIKNYLSQQHFKWFQLYYSIINNQENYLLYFLKKCYKTSLKIYDNCINCCKFNIEWKLLNCIIDSDINNINKRMSKKVYNSVKQSKDLFMTIDGLTRINIVTRYKNYWMYRVHFIFISME